MLDITNYIINDFKPFEGNETIDSVQNFFSDMTYSHFPVVSEGIYIGCVAADDVVTFDNNKTILDYRYTLEGFFARTQMIWLDVLEVFAQNHANIVPVLDESNAYIGYYELNDIIQFFHETPFMNEQGGIIIVRKPTKDFSMSQVAQIVETNNGKILGMFLSEATQDSVQITIKTTLGSLNEIIQTFRRYAYEIVSDHQEDFYIQNLKDRSDYLDKYLNI
ncbi:acetoin utilization protein acuB [Flavobacterium sp. UBA6135]|uniref:acetoin utilization protein acuB n=1 Tax=Flavobacterium sp. UBA6135 TaxID=1946553 RepID=UPI0025C053C7|nr:acetoin utilization protein acuB [Flavobacterium sp. UBA6135]